MYICDITIVCTVRIQGGAKEIKPIFKFMNTYILPIVKARRFLKTL